MTAKEALEKSIEMWQYIKDNKCMTKGQYFTDNNKSRVDCNCYLCEYSSKGCFQCPVKNWSVDGYSSECCDTGSAYCLYNYNITPAYAVADDMLFVLKRALSEGVE